MNLEVNNLTLGYDNTLFEKLNFTIYPNTFTTILGKNGVGKTSLIKALIGDINYSGQIKYNNTLLSNETKEKIRNKISVIYNTNLFIFNNLYDELVFSLQKSGYVDSIIDTTIEDMLNDLNLKYLLYKKISEFSESEKQLGSLLIMIINKPELLIIDNTLNNLEYDLKEKIINYLKKMSISVINVSDNVEDILLRHLY